MAMTLEQYASYLDTRDLVWPTPPAVRPAKARPHLVSMPEVRVVTWNLYGTLLQIFSGELLFEHPQKFVMDIALDKTVQEFNMWGSMTRKPGQPSEYLREMYCKVLSDLRMAPSRVEKTPEIQAEKLWEAIVHKLQKKGYQHDAGFFGSMDEFAQKIAYFFHASLQGTACYAGAGEALEHLHRIGMRQALIADAQCFSFVQLKRGLTAQHCGTSAEQMLDASVQSLSGEIGGRKPSERLFKHALAQLQRQGIVPGQVLHVGARLIHDLAPAKKLGMRTALFAGDKESLQATAEQLKDPAVRPDVLITKLPQIADIVGR